MEQSSANKKAQIVYFPHGGGPLPILGDPVWLERELVER